MNYLPQGITGKEETGTVASEAVTSEGNSEQKATASTSKVILNLGSSIDRQLPLATYRFLWYLFFSLYPISIELLLYISILTVKGILTNFGYFSFGFRTNCIVK